MSDLYYYRCTMPTFSHYERIATMLSIAVCNMSMCLCIFAKPTKNLISMKLCYGLYYIGTYEFGLAFTCAGISFVIHWFVIYVLTNAETVHNKDFLCTTPTRFSKLWRLTTWIFLLIIILGNMAILTIFGLWVELTTSLVWLTTWGISVAICIILFETISCMTISMIQKKVWSSNKLNYMYNYILFNSQHCALILKSFSIQSAHHENDYFCKSKL